jgi:hypothetical protein
LEASSGFELPAPIFEAQGPFVGPSGAILELSTVPWILASLIKFNGEFGPKAFGLGRNTAGKIRGFIPLLSTVNSKRGLNQA